MRNLIIASLLPMLAAVTGAWGQDVDEVSDAPPPPPMREPLPPKVQDPDDQLEPKVVIRQEEGRTVEEYSINGQVYMVRITPAAGPSYYLIDEDGDGELDTRHDGMEPVKPTFWKIMEW